MLGIDILDKIKGNPINKVDIRDLKIEEKKIENRQARTKKQIDEIEKEKNEYIQEGVGADLLTKKTITVKFSKLDNQGKMYLKNFMADNKRLLFVSNLLIVKESENELKSSKVWKTLTSISSDDLEKSLINLSLNGDDFNDTLDKLNDVFGDNLPDYENSENPVETELMTAWANIEAGIMSSEDVEKMTSIERSLEKSD